MNPLWILFIAALCLAVGLAGWLAAGAIILLRRSVYPSRITPQQTAALAGTGYEDVRFPSAGDGTLLSGWFVPAQTQPVHGVVLCCHGMSQTRDEMIGWAEHLWKAGFHVLLFDFRAVGDSEGERATGGFLEAQDVSGAVAYLKARPDCAGLEIGALGFSMGGSAVILAAAEDPRIRAVATLAAYATLDSAIASRCRFHFGPLGPIVDRSFRWLGYRHFHRQPEHIAPVRVVSRLAPRPLLVLHGEKDPIVLPHNARDLYADALEPKYLRLLPDGEHLADLDPQYADAHQQVVEFFQKYLAHDPSTPRYSPPEDAQKQHVSA